MTVENTDPELPWVTNYVETLLSMIWYPSTVATQSRYMRLRVLNYLEATGDTSLIDFKVHDFGFRGSTSVESAGIGDSAHLVSFKGTDTFQGIRVARKYYGEPMAGFSIPAAEHSTITSWGYENEKDAYANMLKAFPTGLVAVVSDSYDIYNACREIWGKELKEAVLARDGVLVVRPDSGYPPDGKVTSSLWVTPILRKAPSSTGSSRSGMSPTGWRTAPSYSPAPAAFSRAMSRAPETGSYHEAPTSSRG